MSDLAGDGLRVRVPHGWEARIVGRDAPQFERGELGVVVAAAPPTRTAVLQMATFPLPADVGDFGGGAVNLMTRSDLFVVLFEYGPESVGTPLFEAQGVPRVRPADFSPATCRRSIPGQTAVQRFFTARGRAFCLYAVLGSHARRVGMTPMVNDALAGLTVEPR